MASWTDVMGVVISMISVGVPLAVAVQQKLWKAVRVVAREEATAVTTIEMRKHIVFTRATERDVNVMKKDIQKLNDIVEIQFYWQAKTNPKMLKDLQVNNQELYDKFAKRLNNGGPHEKRNGD